MDHIRTMTINLNLLVLSTALFLASCGGGSPEDSPQPSYYPQPVMVVVQ